MKFKGKIDLWILIILLLGEASVLCALLDGGGVIGILVTLFYNAIALPFMVRNYVEVTEEKITVVFGFSKNSMNLKDILEVSRTHNPISSTAASLDRIVIKGRNNSLMCSVKKREEFFTHLQEKNPDIDFKNTGKPSEKVKTGKKPTIFSVVICVIVALVLFSGSVKVEYKEESFVIKATYWYNKEIKYEEVQSIEFRDEKITGSRTGGFASVKLLLGDFNNKEFGNYLCYTYSKCEAGVVLMVKDREIVVSGKDVESTREIYEELMSRCSYED